MLSDIRDFTKRCYKISIHILFAFLVKVARGLKKNSSVAYHKSFFKNKNKIHKI